MRYWQTRCRRGFRQARAAATVCRNLLRPIFGLYVGPEKGMISGKPAATGAAITCGCAQPGTRPVSVWSDSKRWNRQLGDEDMANLNKVLLIGRLTRDPEMRYTPSGTAVAEFGLAVNRTYTDGRGERKEETCFVEIVSWARQAEVMNEYLAKGRQVFIEGRLEFDSWETPEGQKRSKLRVVVDNFQFIGGRDEGGGGGGGGYDGGGRSAEPGYVDQRPAPTESRGGGGGGGYPSGGGGNDDVSLGDVPF